jgi:serine/alanine adding enzyme
MKTRLISDIHSIPEGQWHDFVTAHPDGNVFATPDYCKLMLSFDKIHPYAIALMEAEEITGVLCGILYKEYKGILGLISSRLVIMGGPLVKDNDPARAGQLISEMDRLASRKCIYTQYRNLLDVSCFSDLFKKNKYDFEEHLNILVDLTKPREQLWKEAHVKRRNEIKRGEKKGSIVLEVTDPENFRVSYDILNEVYHRAKLPLPDFDYFEKTWNTLSEKKLFRCFGAFYEDRLIGTMYVLCFKETLYDWYAGSYRSDYDKNPNDIIPWNIFLWGKENGYHRFDFGGAGKPGVPYGVRDYKKQFGGEFVNFGRYTRIYNPFLFRIATAGFRIYQAIKR